MSEPETVVGFLDPAARVVACVGCGAPLMSGFDEPTELIEVRWHMRTSSTKLIMEPHTCPCPPSWT